MDISIYHQEELVEGKWVYLSIIRRRLMASQTESGHVMVLIVETMLNPSDHSQVCWETMTRLVILHV